MDVTQFGHGNLESAAVDRLPPDEGMRVGGESLECFSSLLAGTQSDTTWRLPSNDSLMEMKPRPVSPKEGFRN
uniref:Uncharacterized protein n=1 Tax=Physcomitrium patens TaxID=3218 RepID=A0A2K1ICT9_PHYPA|nr:hypothetical protein PHYPA_030581 [Physcomitrium patens]